MAVVLQTGVDAGQTTQVTGTGDFRAQGGGQLNGISSSNLTGATSANANAAIGAVDAAIGVIDTARAGLGATQNRLEFTISTLAIQEENSAASESAIRDANIALETIEFTRNQILVTAGTSILAQANLVPQTALQLLG